MTDSSGVDKLREMTQFVVYGTGVSAYLNLAFPDGRTPLEYLLERIEALRALMTDAGVELSPGVTVVLPPGETPIGIEGNHDYRLVRTEDRTAAGLFRTIERALIDSIEQILWIDLDGPFFRVDLAWYLFQLHRANWCDYTFADGFPEGYAVQILRADILGALAALAQSRGITQSRSVLFDALSVDINAFDVETEAAHEDWALLKASLTVDNRSNALLCRRMVERDLAVHESRDTPDPEYRRFPDDTDPLLRVLLDDPTIRRTVPRYYIVQITEKMAQRPYWTPWSDRRWSPSDDTPSIPVDAWRAVLARIASYTPEAIVAIGYRGEPAEHPEIEAVLESFADFPELSLYVETSGAHWRDETLTVLLALKNLSAVIVHLDASNEERYRAIRGTAEEYRRVMTFIQTLRERRPGVVYVQATRMVDNEEDLAAFYKSWSDVPGVTPLIEKYNSYAGRLPDRRPADLTPLDRNACVHLERDMVILADGTVPMCHQDLDRESVRGNILTDDIDSIWLRGGQDYERHCAGRYSQLCAGCDEYYTFNV